MTYSALYITATGEIIEAGDDADLTAAGTGEAVYVGEADASAHYIVAGVRTDRPTVTTQTEHLITNDGTDSVVIALPSGTVVTDVEDGTQYTSSGVENLTVTSVIYGEFEFVIDPPFPYQTIIIKVSADADS